MYASYVTCGCIRIRNCACSDSILQSIFMRYRIKYLSTFHTTWILLSLFDLLLIFLSIKNSLIFNVYKHGIVILQVTIDNQPPTTQYWPGVQMWYFCMEATVYMIVYTTYSCSRRLLWIRQYYNIVHLGNEEWNFRLFYDFTNWLFRSKQQ